MRGLTPIVLILVCICVGFFYINPQYKKIQAHRLESLEYDKVIAKSVELKKLRDSLSDTLQAFSPSDLDRISKLLPEKVPFEQIQSKKIYVFILIVSIWRSKDIADQGISKFT